MRSSPIAARRFLEDVLAEGQKVHAAVVAELADRPFDTLMRPRYPDEPDERPLMLWIAGDTYGHYGEHAGNIEGCWRGWVGLGRICVRGTGMNRLQVDPRIQTSETSEVLAGAAGLTAAFSLREFA